MFAPAIGNAHGVYQSEPRLDAQRVSDIVAAQPIPIALHGGTGMTDAQFTDLIARGCAKVNISTALKVSYMQANLDFLRGAEERDSWDPPSLFSRGAGGRDRPGGRATCAGSAASARPGEADDGRQPRARARLRRRAGRHRAVRAPGRVQPGLRRVRAAGALERGRVPRTSCRSAAARSGWPACSRRSSSRRPDCPPTRPVSRRRSLPGTGARPRSTPTWWPPAPSRPGRGSPGSSPRRWRPAGRSRWPQPRRRPRSGRRWSGRSAAEQPGRSRSSPATSCRARSRPPTSTCWPSDWLGLPAGQARS